MRSLFLSKYYAKCPVDQGHHMWVLSPIKKMYFIVIHYRQNPVRM